MTAKEKKFFAHAGLSDKFVADAQAKGFSPGVLIQLILQFGLPLILQILAALGVVIPKV